MNLNINLGEKEGKESLTTVIEISGCSCKMEDFIVALIAFSNQWVKDSNLFDEQMKERKFTKTEYKPCGGCKDKKST